MHWLDYAIIYFAFGAPFGVFQATAKREVTVITAFKVASSYLLWPLVAIRDVTRFFLARPVIQKNELETLRVELEKLAVANANSRELYAFREAFYRYAGLAQAANEIPKPLNNLAILNVARNKNHNLREACLFRRDRHKLNVQLANARQDFVEIIAAVNITQVNEVAFKLANYFDDTPLSSIIHSR